MKSTNSICFETTTLRDYVEAILMANFKTRLLKSDFFLTLPIFFSLVFLFLSDLYVGDSQTFLFINQHIQNPILDFVCVYLFIPFFFVLLLTPLVLIFLPRFRQKYRTIGLISVFSGLVSYGVGTAIKVLINKPRPFDVLSVRKLGFWYTSTPSFPSTSTMLAFGLSIPILMEKPRYGYVLIIISFFIGFSVIYVGYHFPVDVLTGAFLSTLSSLFIKLIKRYDLF